MLRGAAKRNRERAEAGYRTITHLQWRNPDNVRLRHDFMVERYDAGDTLKQVAIALRDEFGLERGRVRPMDHSSVLHHLHGGCKCYENQTARRRYPVARPTKPLTKRDKLPVLHREIEKLAEAGMSKLQIAEALGISWDQVRYHRQRLCRCKV